MRGPGEPRAVLGVHLPVSVGGAHPGSRFHSMPNPQSKNLEVLLEPILIGKGRLPPRQGEVPVISARGSLACGFVPRELAAHRQMILDSMCACAPSTPTREGRVLREHSSSCGQF